MLLRVVDDDLAGQGGDGRWLTEHGPRAVPWLLRSAARPSMRLMSSGAKRSGAPRRRRPGLGRARHRLCGLRSHFPEELLIPTVTRCREAGEDGTVVPT